MQINGASNSSTVVNPREYLERYRDSSWISSWILFHLLSLECEFLIHLRGEQEKWTKHERRKGERNKREKVSVVLPLIYAKRYSKPLTRCSLHSKRTLVIPRKIGATALHASALFTRLEKGVGVYF